jgi:hypothetical protein
VQQICIRFSSHDDKQLFNQARSAEIFMKIDNKHTYTLDVNFFLFSKTIKSILTLRIFVVVTYRTYKYSKRKGKAIPVTGRGDL